VIDGTYTPTAGTVTVGTSTIDFSNASTQTIPATFYATLSNSGNGSRTLASSGIVNISTGFSPTSGTTTITGSTIQYSNTSSNTLIAFTTNVANNQYNNLIISGSGSTWSLGSGYNMGIENDFSMTNGTFRVCNNATANTMTVGGNFNLSGGSIFQLITVGTSGAGATVAVTGNTTTSGTSSIAMETTSNTNGVAIFQTTDYR
jgi:hypothetical protein